MRSYVIIHSSTTHFSLKYITIKHGKNAAQKMQFHMLQRKLISLRYFANSQFSKNFSNPSLKKCVFFTEIKTLPWYLIMLFSLRCRYRLEKYFPLFPLPLFLLHHEPRD